MSNKLTESINRGCQRNPSTLTLIRSVTHSSILQLLHPFMYFDVSSIITCTCTPFIRQRLHRVGTLAVRNCKYGGPPVSTTLVPEFLSIPRLSLNSTQAPTLGGNWTAGVAMKVLYGVNSAQWRIQGAAGGVHPPPLMTRSTDEKMGRQVVSMSFRSRLMMSIQFFLGRPGFLL